VDGVYGNHGRREKLCKFWWKTPKERDHSEDWLVNVKSRSEWICRRLAWTVWSGFTWPRIGSGGGLSDSGATEVVSSVINYFILCYNEYSKCIWHEMLHYGTFQFKYFIFFLTTTVCPLLDGRLPASNVSLWGGVVRIRTTLTEPVGTSEQFWDIRWYSVDKWSARRNACTYIGQGKNIERPRTNPPSRVRNLKAQPWDRAATGSSFKSSKFPNVSYFLWTTAHEVLFRLSLLYVQYTQSICALTITFFLKHGFYYSCNVLYCTICKYYVPLLPKHRRWQHLRENCFVGCTAVNAVSH
jgi:hypothetical protein